MTMMMRVSSFLPLSLLLALQLQMVVLNLPVVVVHGTAPAAGILSLAFVPHHRRTITRTRILGETYDYYKRGDENKKEKKTTTTKLYSTREEVSSREENSNFLLEFLRQRSPAEIVFLSGMLLLFATITPLTPTTTDGTGGGSGTNENTAGATSVVVGGSEIYYQQNMKEPGRSERVVNSVFDAYEKGQQQQQRGGIERFLSFPVDLRLPSTGRGDDNNDLSIMTETDVADVVIYSSTQAVQEAVQDLW